MVLFSWVDENKPESKTKLYKYPHVSMMLDAANIGDFVWHNLTYPESLSFPLNISKCKNYIIEHDETATPISQP